MNFVLPFLLPIFAYFLAPSDGCFNQGGGAPPGYPDWQYRTKLVEDCWSYYSYGSNRCQVKEEKELKRIHFDPNTGEEYSEPVGKWLMRNLFTTVRPPLPDDGLGFGVQYTPPFTLPTRRPTNWMSVPRRPAAPAPVVPVAPANFDYGQTILPPYQPVYPGAITYTPAPGIDIGTLGDYMLPLSTLAPKPASQDFQTGNDLQGQYLYDSETPEGHDFFALDDAGGSGALDATDTFSGRTVGGASKTSAGSSATKLHLRRPPAGKKRRPVVVGMLSNNATQFQLFNNSAVAELNETLSSNQAQGFRVYRVMGANGPRLVVLPNKQNQQSATAADSS